MRLAILTHPGEGWQAGVLILAGLMQSLHALAGESPELALVMWDGTPEAEYRSLLQYTDLKIVAQQAGPVQGPAASPAALRPYLAWWLKRRFGRPPPAAPPSDQSDVLRQHQVDCALTLPLEHRPDFGVPLIFWLPDLQHFRLPEMFPAHERARRDRLYRRELEAATRVWVHSHSVQRDIEAFAPAAASKVRVLPSVPSIPPEVYAEEPGALLAEYHLPEKFLLLPNQFWMHKNHRVVFEALHELRQRSIYPTVVCTGHTVDHRNPVYFSALLHQLSVMDLRSQVVLLGVVPHLHVLRLMRQAVCVLNPTLFEGFGMSLAESVSLGKRALVSGLPVLREQNAPGVLYFDPHDAHDLAGKIEQVWQTARPGLDLEMEAAARAALPARQREFAQKFLGLTGEAITVGRAGAAATPASRQP